MSRYLALCEVSPERQLLVEHGKPLVFGKGRDKGIRLRPGSLALEVVTLGAGGATEADLLVHDQGNRLFAMMLAGLRPPAFPMALGVLYDDPVPSYEREVYAQIEQERATSRATLDAVLRGANAWTVECIPASTC